MLIIDSITSSFEYNCFVYANSNSQLKMPSVSSDYHCLLTYLLTYLLNLVANVKASIIFNDNVLI